MSSVNCNDSGPTTRIVFSPWILTTVSADGWQGFVEEEREHCMVLSWFERDSDVHLQWPAALRDEECCELVDLLVVLDNRSEALCGCVFFLKGGSPVTAGSPKQGWG